MDGVGCQYFVQCNSWITATIRGLVKMAISADTATVYVMIQKLMMMLTALVQEIIFWDVAAVLQTIFCYTEPFSVSLLSARQLHLKRSDDRAPLIDSQWWTIISLFRVTSSVRLVEMIDRRSHHRWPSGFSARFRCLHCWETQSVVLVHREWPYYSKPRMNESEQELE